MAATADQEVPFLTTAKLASAIRAGLISSRHALEVLLQRVELLNPSINAVVVFDADRARQTADRADADLAKGKIWGILHGVPCTIKESLDVAGLPSSIGHVKDKNRIAPDSEVCVQRLLDAGAVIYGKTNLPVDAMDVQSYNPVYGSTSNPWKLSTTVGGSSGGSAAAIAAGLVPFDIGSDVGGSIRTPAAFCGVYGHKPSYNIIPVRGPLLDRWPKEVSVRGPLARCPEDLRMLMELMAGADERITARGWQLNLPRPSKGRLSEHRVAIWADDVLCPVDDELVRAAETVARALEKAGARVDRKARPRDFDPEENRKMWITLTEANAAVKAGAQGKGVKASLTEYRMAQEKRELVRNSWESFFDEFDCLVCPSYPVPAFEKIEAEHDFRKRTLKLTKDGKESTIPYLKALNWALLTNTAWLPSTTFPCGVGAQSGLPLGLNIVSREYNDFICIDVARLLEKECGFAFKPPPHYGPSSARKSAL